MKVKSSFIFSMIHREFPFFQRWTGAQCRQRARLFRQSSVFGLPHPSPVGECVPPPLVGGGGGVHTRLGERGWGGEVPIPTSGQSLLYSRYTIYLLCALGKDDFTWVILLIFLILEMWFEPATSKNDLEAAVFFFYYTTLIMKFSDCVCACTNVRGSAFSIYTTVCVCS